jgi:ABC-2 type transport system permease protein
MLRSVFLKGLRDQRWSLLWWALGLVALAFYTLGVYPSIATPEMTQLIENYPPAIRAILGESVSFATPEGYVDAYFFSMMAPLMFMIYAVIAGSGAIAGEEERGSMDWLLSNPIPRWRLVLEKAGALFAGVTLVVLSMWIGLVAGAASIGVRISYGGLAVATLGAGLLGLAFGLVALAVGALRGSRALSLGVALALAIASYMINVYSPLVEGLRPLRGWSLFYHANADRPIVNGLSAEHVAVLITVSVLCVIIAVLGFQRRDLATA